MKVVLVLIFGCTGMLGLAFATFASNPNHMFEGFEGKKKFTPNPVKFGAFENTFKVSQASSSQTVRDRDKESMLAIAKKYSCTSGLQFEKNVSATREFTYLLYYCAEKINELSALNNVVSKEDLNEAGRLRKEYAFLLLPLQAKFDEESLRDRPPDYIKKNIDQLRETRKCRGCSFTNIRLTLDLQSVDLRGANLSGADFGPLTSLSRANLSEANLEGADLRSVIYMHHTNFSKANLQRANFSSGDMREANLSFANLSDAILPRVKLYAANLRSAILRKANLQGATLTYANLVFANLENANLSYADLREADLRAANLTGANITGAKFTDAKLCGATMPDGSKFLPINC